MSTASPMAVFYESLNPSKAIEESFKKQIEEEMKFEKFITAQKQQQQQFDNNQNNIFQEHLPTPQIPHSPETPTSMSTPKMSNNLNKHNWFTDMEIILEVLGVLAYAVYGTLVALILAFIPRSWRFKDISGQIVLVTGAGSGIGRLMAKKFALKHGAIVVAWDINKQGNDETVQEIKQMGGKAYGFIVDVSSRVAIYEAAAKVKSEVGKVDILVNNAGIVSGKPFLDTPDAMIEKTFAVNSLSLFWTTKAFLPDMLKDGRGHLVTIASLAGLFGSNRLVDYCSSKHAAVGFDESIKNELRVEIGAKNIYNTLVCPYYINTGMFDGVHSKILPILKPDYVVEDIIAGVLSNQEQLIIPRYAMALIFLKMLLPGEVVRRFAVAAGITGTMLTFTGRKDTKKE